MTLLTTDAETRRRHVPMILLLVAAGLMVAAAVWLAVSTTRHEVSTKSFALYTHCGVDRATIGGMEYVAARPLYRDDGYGNPPAGWDNPTQSGVMTVYSDGTAVFRHPDGQEVTFVRDARRASVLRPCA